MTKRMQKIIYLAAVPALAVLAVLAVLVPITSTWYHG
jgi:hypothetical protein